MTASRKGRIEAFLNPFDYIQGSGFQIANGYIAIGSGGVKGLGLGNSIQKMGYLPEPHTDVIMAVISEELGILRCDYCRWGTWIHRLTCIVHCTKGKRSSSKNASGWYWEYDWNPDIC